jgi:hypothetical protein
MTVHVDEMVTEVSVEPETAAGPAARAPSDWQAAARIRERHARLEADAWRTAAEGFDD